MFGCVLARNKKTDPPPPPPPTYLASKKPNPCRVKLIQKCDKQAHQIILWTQRDPHAFLYLFDFFFYVTFMDSRNLFSYSCQMIILLNNEVSALMFTMLHIFYIYITGNIP